MPSLEISLSVLLAMVLVWAGGLNLFAPAFIRDEFARWGYPQFLRIAAGSVEWAAAVLLLVSGYRRLGALLALIVLVGVVFTLLRAREGLRIEYPLVLLALSILLALTVEDV